jgi:hypothetical protein
MKKRDDLNDVIREESSRGRKRPINTAAINEKAERTDAVLRIFRRGTREDLLGASEELGLFQGGN